MPISTSASQRCDTAISSGGGAWAQERRASKLERLRHARGSNGRRSTSGERGDLLWRRGRRHGAVGRVCRAGDARRGERSTSESIARRLDMRLDV